MDFFTMGMFILDEIVYPDKSNLSDVIGGAGIYAAQSAGLFLDPTRRSGAAMIIDAGRDFPSSIKQEIDSWKLGIIWRNNPNRLTTRGLNTYLQNDERDFKYITPKLRIEQSDFAEVGAEDAKSLHLICSPSRCREICEAQLASGHKDQLFVWEPVPTECLPSQWDACQEMFGIAHVISPNAKEAAAFVGLEEPMSKPEIEAIADRWKQYKGLFIIRCGNLGALVVSAGAKKWYSPYHTPATKFKVVDPTGGGNSFMGGLCISLVKDRTNIDRALVWAMVAAGIQIEQVGLARYDAENDLWNGTRIEDRIELYNSRKLD